MDRIIRLLARRFPELARAIAWGLAYSLLGCSGVMTPLMDGARAEDAPDGAIVDPTPAGDAGPAITAEAAPPAAPAQSYVDGIATYTPDGGPVPVNGVCLWPALCTGTCEGAKSADRWCSQICVGTCRAADTCPGGCESNFYGTCGGICWGQCRFEGVHGLCASLCTGQCDSQAMGSCAPRYCK